MTFILATVLSNTVLALGVSRESAVPLTVLSQRELSTAVRMFQNSACATRSLRLNGGMSLGLQSESGAAEPSSTQCSEIKSFHCWDWKTGRGLERHGEILFTVFRNRKTRAAVEIVHDDHEMCIGFFRFLSSNIFEIEPESPLFVNSAKDCPGYACLVNGIFTGDFFQAPNLYHELASESSFQVPRVWKSSESFAVGNWSVLPCGKSMVLQRADCEPARLVLTDDGFIYEGGVDPEGWATSSPQGVVLSGSDTPKSVDFNDAHEAIKFAMDEGTPC